MDLKEIVTTINLSPKKFIELRAIVIVHRVYRNFKIAFNNNNKEPTSWDIL